MRSATAEMVQLAVDAPEDSLLWLATPNLVVVAEAGRLLPIAGRLVARSIPWLLETDDPTHPAVVGHRRALDGWVAPYQTLFRAHWYDVAVAPVVEDGTVVGVKGAAVLRGNRRWMDGVWRPRLTVVRSVACPPPAEPTAEFRVLRDYAPFGLVAGMVLVATASRLYVPGRAEGLPAAELCWLLSEHVVALDSPRLSHRPHLRLM